MKTRRMSSNQGSPLQAGSRSTTAALVLASLTLLAAGCVVDGDAVDYMNDSFVTDGFQATNPPEITPGPGCYVDRFHQPDAQITRKIDILFMVDTSGSLVEERGGIADGIDAFVGALPANVDFRIGVMTGHSSGSSWSGKLYRKGGSYPYVYDSQTMDLATIRTKLHTTLTLNMPNDNSADGGEEGMVSMNRAMDDDRLELARGQGFFRDDAALAVVFVSDENDICAIYPDGVTPVPDPQGIENVAHAQHCTRMAPAKMDGTTVIAPEHMETITADLVVGKLKALKGDMPLVVSAAVYANPATVPQVGENEVGYGLIDMAQIAHGVVIDLATGQYSDGLAQVGTLASIKMNLQTDFVLTHGNVDSNSLQINVDGVGTADYDYDSEVNTVAVAHPGGPLSTIDISYCEMPPAPPVVGGVDAGCSAGSFAAKSQIKVGMTNDPAEGSQATILSGLALIGVTPTVYTDSQIIAGVPQADGITVMIVARKAVVSPVSPDWVTAVRALATSGVSILAEYDGGALVFSQFNGLNTAFTGHMPPSLALFDGNAAGGGLLLPVSASTMSITDHSDPLMAGISADTVTSGLRTAFAITDFNSTWLHPSANFTSTGFSNLVPAGTFPAVMSGRCGGGRVAIVMMNQLQALGSSADVRTLFNNSFHWLAGQ
jgi:hypothetical protein